MKLKREQTSFMKFSKVFKGLLFFGTLLLMNSLSAQNIIITSSDADAAEVTAPGTPNTASFTISRDFNNAQGSFVSYTVTGTSISGTDHDLANGNVTFIFNEPLAITTVINIVDDDLVEGLETITVTLSPIVLGSGSVDPTQNTVTLNIADNDSGTFSLEVLDANAAEENQDEGRFRISLDKENATSTTVTLPYTLTGDANNGGANSDYNVIGQGTFTFPAGQFVRTLRIEPIDDGLVEGDETVTLTLGTPSDNLLFSVAVPNNGTVTIEDNDCAAGDVAPVLNNNPTAFCGAFNVPLDDYLQSMRPPGAGLVWSTNSDPSVMADWIPFANDSPVSQPGTYYGFFRDEINECYSPTVTLVLTQSFQPSAGNATNASRCNESGFGEPTSIDLDNTLSGQDAGGTWTYISGGTGNPGINGNNVVNFNGDPEGNYVFRYTVLGVAPCNDDTEDVTITVTGCDPCIAGDNAPVLDTNIPATVCDAFTNSFNDYTNSAPPSGTVLTWSTDSNPLNTNAHLTPAQANNPPTVGGTYYGFFYDAVNTCASPTLQINLVLNITPTLSGVTGNERCGPGTVILTAMASDNGTINWYTSATGGSAIGTGSSFTTPTISATTSYFAEATLNGCPSERQEAIAIVQQQPSAGTLQNGGNASACNVAANGPTILDLDDLISGEDAGAWAYTSGPFADFTIPSNNILNFEGRPDGDYVFTYTTTGAQAPCMDESAVLTISVNDCDVDTDMDGLFDGPEAILGTDPNNPDTDGDGINDGEEVGDDLDNPLDSDLDSEGMASPDGIIDALDSNILDIDNDGVVDQLDPGNDNPCVPTRLNGVCDFDADDVPDIDDPEPDNPCVPSITHPNCNPDPVDLEITKEVDNINALLGEEVTFTVTLKNLDLNAKSRNIKVGDILESGFEYISHDTSVGTYNVDNGEWDIFEIEPQSTNTLTIKVKIIEGGTYDNTAELLDSFPIDDNPANDRATVTLPIELPEGVNLILEKTVSLGIGKEKLKEVTGLVSDVTPEVEVIYYLKVINKSLQDAVSNIRVNDVFTNDTDVQFEIVDVAVPAETTFDEASGIWVINKSLSVEEEIELSIRVVFRSTGVVTNTGLIESSVPRESTIGDADSTSSANVEITTRNEVEIGILYNQFSPNNDGLNDLLKVNRIKKNEDGEDELVEIIYDIQIFNRYGNLVFEAASKQDDEVWDGSWKGKDAPDGTYFYTMNLDFGEGSTIQKGWIQLIR